MLDLTVAICAHNAAARLPACLAALAAQEVPAWIRWEVLVIDNASTDTTATVALHGSTAIPATESIRIVREATPGLIHARVRAAREAAGELIAFVDDDNLVDPDFVRNAVAFFQRHPEAGIAGGRIRPFFEPGVMPPPDFDSRFADSLACRDHGDTERRLIPPTDDPPPGAGMVGRRSVFRAALIGIGCVLTGRAGKRLTSGEDTEIGLIAHRLGWQLWHTPDLSLAHLMPASRLTDAYLHRIIAGGARAQAWLDLLRGKSTPQSRPGYTLTALRHELAAARFATLAHLRKSHPHAPKYTFWQNLYHGRASGYWQLALHNPWPRLQRRLRSPSAKREQLVLR